MTMYSKTSNHTDYFARMHSTSTCRPAITASASYSPPPSVLPASPVPFGTAVAEDTADLDIHTVRVAVVADIQDIELLHTDYTSIALVAASSAQDPVVHFVLVDLPLLIM